MSGVLALPRFADRRILIPTVTGGCEDPTCDKYDIFGDGVLAQVVSEAASNLLKSLPGGQDNTTFENGTIGYWDCAGGSVSTNWSWHGLKSMRIQYATADYHCRLPVTAVTTAGSQYTAQMYVNNVTGYTLRLSLWDNVGGYVAHGTTVTVGNEGRMQVTGTFNSESTIRRIVVGAIAGSYPIDFYIDAVQLENKSYPTWFSNGDRTAMTCKVATADLGLTAGPTSIVCVFKPVWDNTDGICHRLVVNNSGSSVNALWLYKHSDDKITFAIGDKNGSYFFLRIREDFSAGSVVVVVATLDNKGDVTLHVNGVQATETEGSGTKIRDGWPADLYIGTSHEETEHANAPIHIAMLNRVLTPNEISDIFSELGVS